MSPRAVVIERAVAVLVLLARLAHADDINTRPLTLARDHFAVDLTLEANLEPNEVTHPLSLAPDVWWGATPQLTVGVIHSSRSVDRIAPGASVCVVTGGAELPCNHPYQNVGLDLLYSAVANVAPRIRLLERDIDVGKPAITLGALARWTHGRYTIWTDPYLQLGLAHLDRGNRAELFVPIVLSLEVRRVAIDLHTGYNSDLAIWTDGFHIPLELGVRTAPTPHLELSAAFGFYSLLGPQNNSKERALFVTVGWRS